MNETAQGLGYRVWAVDNMVYGPVELPTLVAWVKDQRVLAETWLFVERDDAWRKAATVEELRMFFQKGSSPEASAAARASAMKGLTPGMLRRVKILADFSDVELERLVQVMDVQKVPPWRVIVKQGEAGDALFMLLEGEVRVRLMIEGVETTLTTMGPGEFFGEISLFDAGPRSADVVSNKESVLLKVSAAAFDQFMKAAPDVAAHFLLATAKTLTSRIRADNKRYQDSVVFARAAQ